MRGVEVLALTWGSRDDCEADWMAEVCDDKAHSGKRFILVPLHLGNHISRNVPTLGLMSEEETIAFERALREALPAGALFPFEVLRLLEAL